MTENVEEAPTRFRVWREKQGWTLQEISDLTGISVGTLSRVERGERVCSPATKVAIARRLRANVADLFEIEPVEAVG